METAIGLTISVLPEDSYFRMQMYKSMEEALITAGGGIVYNKEGKLLMIFRRGFWDLPKGKQEEGERIEDCALREVEEETGLKDIRLGKLIGITTHHYFNTWTNKNTKKETHWFEMHISNNQTLTPQAEEEIEKAEWVDKTIAKEYLKKTYANIVEIIEKSGFLG